VSISIDALAALLLLLSVLLWAGRSIVECRRVVPRQSSREELG
jgi:hypothetical protein